MLTLYQPAYKLREEQKIAGNIILTADCTKIVASLLPIDSVHLLNIHVLTVPQLSKKTNI